MSTAHASLFGGLSLPLLNAWHGEPLLLYGDGVSPQTLVALVGPETVDERSNRKEGRDMQMVRQFTVYTAQVPDLPLASTVLEYAGRQYALDRIEGRGSVTVLHGIATGFANVNRVGYRG